MIACTNSKSIGVMGEGVAPLTGYFSKNGANLPTRSRLFFQHGEAVVEELSADARRSLAFVAAILYDPVEPLRHTAVQTRKRSLLHVHSHVLVRAHLFSESQLHLYTDAAAVTLSCACSCTFRCRCRSHSLALSLSFYLHFRPVPLPSHTFLCSRSSSSLSQHILFLALYTMCCCSFFF